ncbi:hypothetical protein GE09DRAFT_297735 [Coniochaeta sp. 2T2.1]|nr:hypothetical protein GE09DRAFT_297735 [Coniochaeta sp. 2T2.1]
MISMDYLLCCLYFWVPSLSSWMFDSRIKHFPTSSAEGGENTTISYPQFSNTSLNSGADGGDWSAENGGYGAHPWTPLPEFVARNIACRLIQSVLLAFTSPLAQKQDRIQRSDRLAASTATIHCRYGGMSTGYAQELAVDPLSSLFTCQVSSPLQWRSPSSSPDVDLRCQRNRATILQGRTMLEGLCPDWQVQNRSPTYRFFVIGEDI